MVDYPPGSVFVVVMRRSTLAPYFCSILQFPSPDADYDDSPPSSEKAEVWPLISEPIQLEIPEQNPEPLLLEQTPLPEPLLLEHTPPDQYLEPPIPPSEKVEPIPPDLYLEGAEAGKVDESEPLPSWGRLAHYKEYVAHLASLWVPPPQVQYPGPRVPAPATRCPAAPLPATHVPPGTKWMFSTAPEGLCMVPFLDDISSQEADHPLPLLVGRLFNVRTKSFQKMRPSFNFNPDVGCAVTLNGCIYFMPDPSGLNPCGFININPPCFERYDPSRDMWETLAPFPAPSRSHIRATAVLYDNILFNMVGIHRKAEIWAYNVTLNKWYRVTVLNKLCYGIVGEAAVQGGTIFALKDRSYNSVLALSIQIRKSVDDASILEFTCSLVCEIWVRGLKRVSSRYGREVDETRHLVHLSKDKFCLVQSCQIECWPVDSQPVQLSYMTLDRGNMSMIVTHNFVHEVPVVDSVQFHVAFCFSMPEFNTTPPSIQAHKFFDINPFPKDFDLKSFNLWNHFLGTYTKDPLFEDFESTSSVPMPKRLKTVGKDFQQGGGSKTGDPEESSASERGKTVGEGPVKQVRLSHRERGKIIRRWREKYLPHAMESYSLCDEASLSGDE